MHQDLNVLRHQLVGSQDRFLSAFSAGDTALEDFDRYWNALTTKLTYGIQEGWVPDDVVELARRSATSIAAVADSLLAFQESAASAITHVGNALETLSLDESVHALPYHSSPSYIPEAYEWLLDNVYNPYPTSDTKEFLACRSGLSTRNIHDWFKEIRRCIGWVDFCKKHFGGSRALAIEAATQVLLQQGPSCGISPEVEIDISVLQGRVECLYFARHETSGHARNPSHKDPFLRPRRSRSPTGLASLGDLQPRHPLETTLPRREVGSVAYHDQYARSI